MEDKLALRDWIMVTARIEKEMVKQYRGEGPVLYPTEITPADPPKEDIVYFN